VDAVSGVPSPRAPVIKVSTGRALVIKVDPRRARDCVCT